MGNKEEEGKESEKRKKEQKRKRKRVRIKGNIKGLDSPQASPGPEVCKSLEPIRLCFPHLVSMQHFLCCVYHCIVRHPNEPCGHTAINHVDKSKSVTSDLGLWQC
jgi:hypothetical protein